MDIRIANENDISTLLIFLNKIFIYEQKINTEIITPSKEFLWKIESEMLEQVWNNRYFFLIWEVNGEAIWFLKWRLGDKPGIWSYNRFSYIEALFIDEKYRKRWFAQNFCDRFFTWAVKNWSDKVLLDVIKGNVKAVKLYEKLWFTHHTITYGKDL